MKLTITNENTRVSFKSNDEPAILCPSCGVTTGISRWKYEKSATLVTEFFWSDKDSRLKPMKTDAWTEDDGGFVCPECGERVEGRAEDFLYDASEQGGLYLYGDVTIDGHSENPELSEPQSQEP